MGVREHTVTTLTCDCCKRSFKDKYNHGGSIEHDNNTSDFNMEAFVNIYNDDECDNYREVFLDSILLDGNLCNIDGITYDVAIQIYECKIKWLKKEGYDEVADYLKSKRPYIRDEFNKVTRALIAEAEKESGSNLDYLRSKILE